MLHCSPGAHSHSHFLPLQPGRDTHQPGPTILPASPASTLTSQVPTDLARSSIARTSYTTGAPTRLSAQVKSSPSQTRSSKPNCVCLVHQSQVSSLESQSPCLLVGLRLHNRNGPHPSALAHASAHAHPRPRPATEDPVPAGYSSGRPIFVFLCVQVGVRALVHRLLSTLPPSPCSPQLCTSTRDVTTSYVSDRRMLLDVALGCSCQTPLLWPGCRSSRACCWPPAIAAAAAAPAASAANDLFIASPPYASHCCQPSSPPPSARHLQVPRHTNHSCALSPPTRLPSRLQPRHTPRRPLNDPAYESLRAYPALSSTRAHR